MIVVVMGVAGSGKSTVGAEVAKALGMSFYDADDFHPPENVAKISHNEPLNDADRDPWLQRLVEAFERATAEGQDAVFACSALKRTYRDRLRSGPAAVRFVYLNVPKAVLAQRLEDRPGHFAGPGLLDSQCATLEPPDEREALIVPGTLPISDMVAFIRDARVDAPLEDRQ